MIVCTHRASGANQLPPRHEELPQPLGPRFIQSLRSSCLGRDIQLP